MPEGKLGEKTRPIKESTTGMLDRNMGYMNMGVLPVGIEGLAVPQGGGLSARCFTISFAVRGTIHELREKVQTTVVMSERKKQANERGSRT